MSTLNATPRWCPLLLTSDSLTKLKRSLEQLEYDLKEMRAPMNVRHSVRDAQLGIEYATAWWWRQPSPKTSTFKDER